MKEISRYDHVESMEQLKIVLDPKDYKYNKTSNQKTAVIADFMSLLRKVFCEIFQNKKRF